MPLRHRHGVMTIARFAAVVVTALVALAAPEARGQSTSLGTFRWQLRPYCNVLTVQVDARGDTFHVHGTDDQCGAPSPASVRGLAFPNPDGSIGLGLTTIVVPAATAVYVDATVNAGSGSGTWRDSAGNEGAFVLTPGPSTGGSTRPVPPGGIRPGSITATEIAPGGITARELSGTSVALAIGARGDCAPGQVADGFTTDGAMRCRGVVPTMSTTLPYSEAFYVDLAMGADGLPVIAHVDLGAGGLRVTHCGNASCSSGNTSTVLWPATELAQTTIRVGADGVTNVIGTVRGVGSSPDVIRIARCGTPACTTGNQLHDLSVTGLDAAPAVDFGANGRLILTYVDDDAGSVRQLHCGDAMCAVGNVAVVVDVDPALPGGRSLRFEVARTRVSPNGEVIVDVARIPNVGTWSYVQARCTPTGCTPPVLRPPLSGRQLRVAGDGLPIGVLAPLLRSSFGDGRLRLVHCGDINCETSAIVVAGTQDGASVGHVPSLTLGSDGLAVVSHWDITHETLRVTRCVNATCSSSVSTTADDPAQSVGNQSVIAIGLDGMPLVVHRDAAAQALRITKCSTRDCR